uniref:BZIP domain-containing protein n=1 Tax=Panagrolaimus superbus TaxID=310955 RepID=A0A914YHX3_9BILA
MEYYRPMASQYLQPQRQHVSYSPNKQTNGTQQVPATSMYTTSSGFQTFQTVLTPTYTDANGEHVTKIEPHDGEHQQLRVLMPVYQNATSSGTQIKFVDASGAGNSVIFSTSNGSYAQNGTIVHHQQQQPQQYQTIQIANHQHGQIGHQIVNGQLINSSNGQQHFSNPVQYIVVQSTPNGNTVPVEIKSEIDPPMVITQSQDGVNVRRAKDANRKRRRRLTESEEEAMARRQKNLEAKRRRLARETDDERRRRRQRDAEAKRKRRERETEEQRLSRLKRDSERMRRTRRLKNFRLQNKDGVPDEIIQAESHQQHQQSQQPTHSRSSHQQNNQHAVTVSNSMPPPTRIVHHPKQEPTSYLSSNSSAAINQTIAAVVDNKHSNMVVLDQKPLPQGAFISTGHPHTIQIPANSMVQTVQVPQGMLIPSSQGGGVQQIILLPPSGQPTNAITIPPGTQIIHQRHADSSASSVSSSFITEAVQQQHPQQHQSNIILPDDPTERQRIRNKERARRRRALETPEQRAMRNMKTAERMRRRRAQLAEQRALEHGHSQPIKVNLTDEEYNHRFDDIFECVLKRADYEVENNGPICPRPKFPPGYHQPQPEQIFVEENPESFVLEHMDSSGLQTDGEEQEYKPSLDEDGNTNGVDESSHHDGSLHGSSISHDDLDDEEDISQDHDDDNHVDHDEMLQRL